MVFKKHFARLFAAGLFVSAKVSGRLPAPKAAFAAGCWRVADLPTSSEFGLA
jgi:hypothetical protein